MKVSTKLSGRTANPNNNVWDRAELCRHFDLFVVVYRFYRAITAKLGNSKSLQNITIFVA